MAVDAQGSRVAVRIGRALTVVAAALLLVWVVAPRSVAVLGGGGVPTKPGTALALLLVGVVIGWPALSRRVRFALLATAGTVAVEAVLAMALDRPLLSAYRLFPASWQAATPDGSGTMAVSSALCLLLLTTAIALGASRRRVTTVLCLTAFGVAYVGALGHLYGVSALYTLQSATSMAVPTALAVLVAAVATAVADPTMPVPVMLTVRGAAGVLVRRLLPWALLAPAVLGWARLAGEDAGMYGPLFGLSLMVLAFTMGTVAVTVLGSRAAARTEQARDRAADELALLNTALSERVAEALADAEEGRDRLHESERLHRSVVATMAEGVVVLDGSGRIVTVNEAACGLLGREPEELLGPDIVDPRLRWLRDDGSELPLEEHPSVVALRTGRAVRDVTLGVRRPDRSLVWLTVSSEPLVDADGRTEGSPAAGVVTTFIDVTAARAAVAALRRSEEQFRHAMAMAPIGMALVELDGRFREVNRALARLVGYDETELVGLTFQEITHPDDLEADLSNVARLLEGSLDHYTMEKRYLTRSGEIVWVLLAVSLARDDQDRPAYFISQIQDVTDTRAAQERLAHRALHDPLTGLPNRDLLMDHLSHALAHAARSGTSTAVMFCDLDNFKVVNDTYGHEAGDQLLVSVANRLRAVMRPGDKVARLGGDEFVVVAEGLPDTAAVRVLAERVQLALDEPLHLDGDVVRTGVSIGVAIAGDEDDARSVLREADAAMYRAKALGRGRLELSDGGGWGDGRPVVGLRTAAELDPRPA